MEEGIEVAMDEAGRSNRIGSRVGVGIIIPCGIPNIEADDVACGVNGVIGVIGVGWRTVGVSGVVCCCC